MSLKEILYAAYGFTLVGLRFFGITIDRNHDLAVLDWFMNTFLGD